MAVYRRDKSMTRYEEIFICGVCGEDRGGPTGCCSCDVEAEQHPEDRTLISYEQFEATDRCDYCGSNWFGLETWSHSPDISVCLGCGKVEEI